MGKTSAFRNLLYSLSRLPGLGFLRGAASSAAQVERTGQNIESAKRAADELKPDKKEEDKPAEEEKDKSAEEKE